MIQEMIQEANRKDYMSTGLSKNEANIIRLYSRDLFRSVSETIRIIIIDYIKKNKLEQKYSICIDE